MNVQVTIICFLILIVLLLVIIWLAMQVQKTKDSLKIDIGKANEEALQKHLRQTQQQERLKNMAISELDTILDKLHTDKENASK